MKVCLITLGCDKNLVDAEVMLGSLYSCGYEFTDDEELADVIVVNTCCFINDAKEESIDTILRVAEYKKTKVLKALVVSGCMAQRYQDEIKAEIPEVDAIVGTGAIDSLSDVVRDILAGSATDVIGALNFLPDYSKDRILTTGGYYAHLKIAEGCDKRCTYCIIPYVRGRYRSVEIDKLISQANELVLKGVRELILVAQETTLYGVDIYGKKMLPSLLESLCAIEELKWIRILYCYPEEITDELIDTIANNDKICNYLDIPIQHSSDNILRLMGRKTSEESIREIITKIRTRIPDIAIRTTLISGFPGETDSDHYNLCRFVEDMRFDRLGVFTYSAEEGTPAASMDGQVDEAIMESRRNEIMEIQQDIAFDIAKSSIGQEVEVIVEGRFEESLDEEELQDILNERVGSIEDISIDNRWIYVGRSYKDSPSIDGMVFFYSEREYISGEYANIIIEGARGYDLIGSIKEV